jgi:hypothetical protein
MNDADTGYFQACDLWFVHHSKHFSQSVVDEVKSLLAETMALEITPEVFERFVNARILNVRPEKMAKILKRRLKLLLGHLQRKDKGYTRVITNIVHRSIRVVYEPHDTIPKIRV